MAALAAMALEAPAIITGKIKSPGNAPGLSVRAKVKGGDDLALVLQRYFPSFDSARQLLLDHLAVQVDVEAFDFDGLAHPDAGDDVDDDKDHEGG